MKSLRKVLLVLMVDTAGGALPAALLYLFQLAPDLEVLIHLKFGEVYAHCIGSLCFLVMGRVGQRILRLRPMYQVAAHALMLVLLAGIVAPPAGLVVTALHY